MKKILKNYIKAQFLLTEVEKYRSLSADYVQEKRKQILNLVRIKIAPNAID